MADQTAHSVKGADADRNLKPKRKLKMGGIYGDEFERNMNVLTSPANIKATAKKFVEFEKANGPYSFGMFAKTLLPRAADWADEYGSTKGYNSWEKHAGAIPKDVTARITSVVFANYRSENPLPVLLKIGTNVDATFDTQVKNFVHDGIEYIGILMLCPNPDLKAAVKSEQLEKAPA
jgi:hypothetical protein